jgi:hypothetical protein
MSKALLDRLGIWVDVKFVLYQFPRNSCMSAGYHAKISLFF